MFHRVTRALLGSHSSGGTNAFQSSDPTVIESGTRITGEISGSGGLLLQGSIDGDIEVSGSVVVGPAGRATGRVEADEIHLEGSIEGEVQARSRLSIEASGVLEGGFHSPRLVIEEGGRLLGSCRMQGAAAQSRETPAGAERKAPTPVRPLTEAVEG